MVIKSGQGFRETFKQGKIFVRDLTSERNICMQETEGIQLFKGKVEI